MNKHVLLRCSTWCALGLLALGLVTGAQAQTAGSAVMLNDAYATLAQAKHDYKGHRVKAMKQIELALGEVGAKVSKTGKPHEPQGTSDAQLRAAQGLVRQASGGLSGKALKHADAALSQLNEALEIK